MGVFQVCMSVLSLGWDRAQASQSIIVAIWSGLRASTA